ncbi:MAG TPA: hypothetical protein VL500_04125 [Candidatus Eisenbacteria bacterium]|jgi:hypothetical protein|nr:hypothetical protein [Candidatus Eisenbacteria bacterium]
MHILKREIEIVTAPSWKFIGLLTALFLAAIVAFGSYTSGFEDGYGLGLVEGFHAVRHDSDSRVCVIVAIEKTYERDVTGFVIKKLEGGKLVDQWRTPHPVTVVRRSPCFDGQPMDCLEVRDPDLRGGAFYETVADDETVTYTYDTRIIDLR